MGRPKTHGMCNTSTYHTWESIHQRCKNPKNPGYKWYGGRGIKVCKRWHKFENFYEDMGDKPEGLTLERINNDGDYEPGNCEWATWKEQRKNQRSPSYGPCKQHWFFAFNKKIGEWDEDNNQHEFARRWDLNNSQISSCLHGRRRQHKGWIFQWLPT